MTERHVTAVAGDSSLQPAARDDVDGRRRGKGLPSTLAIDAIMAEGEDDSSDSETAG